MSLSRKIFGITRADTEFDTPVGFYNGSMSEEDKDTLRRKSAAHEARFVTPGLTDRAVLGVLASLGLDSADNGGDPLRCLCLFDCQAEAAARGIMGRLPDCAAAKAENWGAGLELEAAAFQATLQNASRPSPNGP